MAQRQDSGWIRAHSAGGVVVRVNGEPEFLAIQPAHRNRWQLPKGTIERHETPQQAAVREVREEGGVHASIAAELGPITFFFRMNGQRFVKTVDFYLMVYRSGSPADHDHEVKEARWFPLAECSRLAFETERDLVQKASDLLPSIGIEA